MQVGVHELKQKTSELIRLVREEGHTITITCHGKPVAMLTPVEPHTLDEETEQAWLALEQLAHQITKAWSIEISAIDAHREASG